jgi:hypothetical protein
MAEIVNLRVARKRRSRLEAEKAAAENRALHGVSRSAKDTEKISRAVSERRHENHRREHGGDAEP